MLGVFLFVCVKVVPVAIYSLAIEIQLHVGNWLQYQVNDNNVMVNFLNFGDHVLPHTVEHSVLGLIMILLKDTSGCRY